MDTITRRLSAPVHYEQPFEPEAFSAVAARAFVNARLSAHGVISPDCELVVSELMANVVQHARTPVTVRLVVDTTLRVEVHDGNSIIPAMVEAAEDAESGRGLFIIEALSSAWGVSSTADGKCVWAEIAREAGRQIL